MTFKALLLGSAAAIATAGGAQAADLMADSVDYVKVCDAFGSGYYYIPGSDTCLKFDGRFRYEMYVGDDQGKDGEAATKAATATYVALTVTTIATAGTPNSSGYHTTTRADLNVTAAKMTSHGPLIGSMTMKANGNGAGFVADSMWLQWGHVTFGYDDSLTRMASGYSLYGSGTGARLGGSQGFARVDWALGGHTVSVAVEEANYTSKSYIDDDMPAFTAKLTGKHDIWSYGIAGGYVPGDKGDSGGVVTGYVEAKLDALAPGDKIKFAGGWGSDAGPLGFGWTDTYKKGDTTAWFVSFRHEWGGGWQSNVSYGQVDVPTGALKKTGDFSEVRFNTLYKGVPGLEIGPEIRWVRYDTTPALPISGKDVTYGLFHIQWDWE